MIKKSATSGGYTIVQHDNGSISVYQSFDNTKGALREIAEAIGFDYDPSWTTRGLGWDLIKHLNGNNQERVAESGEYVITRHESGSIEVSRTFDNTKGALREIAEVIGFDYDEGWNTRTFGSKLIDELNK